ncbi:MAG: N-6 DNA methylase [Gordonia sp. (in: high G+C Gram-positive bacteria)]
MLPGDSAVLRKARGAFFTPEPVARFLVRWAVRTDVDAVLEPSCGEAVFLHELGVRGHRGPLVGVELHAGSAQEAQRSLRRRGIAATIHDGDFFEYRDLGGYDAVVGNPPYIRYQDFSGEARAAARSAARGGGVRLTNLASSWAAFTVHSARHLKVGGRLALVLPAELLTVNYAAEVRRFLLEHFTSVGLVLFAERVFPDVQEEVVLLLAEGYTGPGGTGTDHVTVRMAKDADDLANPAISRRWAPPHAAAKWSGGLLSAAGERIYDEAVTSGVFGTLSTWGETTLGMVTGNNRFFTLSPSTVAELGLADSDVVELSPPGSRHLRQLSLTSARWKSLGAQGAATYLFRPPGDPSAAARRYIESGESLDVHTAYKCRVRSPWWRVPYLRPADLFLTYMNADTPRLVTNRVGAHHLNSVHGVYLRPGVKGLGKGLLPIASLNSLTLLGAETVGRAYGGGILKLEPREADRWPMPPPEVVGRAAGSLRSVRPAVAAALAHGELLEAVAMVDDVLLKGVLGLGDQQLGVLRHDHAELTARRSARGRRAHRGD